MGMISYEDSYKLAAQQVASIEDLRSVSKRCAVEVDGGAFSVCYFRRLYRLQVPSCFFEPGDLALEEKILILHYLSSTDPPDPSPELVTFSGLSGGMFYYPTYRKRGPNRVLKAFGAAPDRLFDAAAALGGRKADFGDVSVVIPILPHIDFTVVIHRGDEEFPPETQFLFRKDITAFLPLEDVAVIGGIIATRLQKAVR